MRLCACLILGLAVGAACAAEPELARARDQAERGVPVRAGAAARMALAAASSKGRGQPYEGIWADSNAACRAPDGVDRMIIRGNLLQWYETRCQAGTITPAGERSWTMRVSCEGEGQKYRGRLRVSLPAPNKLIMEDSPVGPTKHQSYLRCNGR